MCQGGGVEQPPEEASMGQASTIGLDIAKRVFQAHGADATGRVVFRKRLVRAKVLEFSRGSRAVLWRWRLVAGRTTGRGSLASWATRCADPTRLREALRQAAEE